MNANEKWYFESGKVYDISYINTRDYICDFELFGEFVELFGGEYDSTETIDTNLNPQETIYEIASFVSFVYDIPAHLVFVAPNYAK